MENSNNVGVTIFLIVIGILWVKMVVYENRRDKEEKAAAAAKKAAVKKEKQDAIDAELEIVRAANEALPDLEAAFSILRNSYKWDAIVRTIGVSSIELELLRWIPADVPETIKLPNLQSTKYDFDEKRVMAKVWKITSVEDDVPFYGADAYAQEPTAHSMQELVNGGYVTLHKPVTATSRKFLCSLTPSGEALCRLGGSFSLEGMDKHLFKHAPCSEARGEVAQVVYRAMKLIRDGEAVWPKRANT
jgi:hypothetical protein